MPFDRADALRRLATEEFDVLVVGGGITGAGVALDAAARGLRTALVERRDLASGTSSKSSKLVHGGLRYLQQRDFRLVYEALHERQRLRRTAPHLVHLLPFLMPMFGKGGLVHPKLVKALNSALWMYDLTGGARIGKLHERISAEEVLAHMPTLRRDRVVGGFVYYDARTDDARLTLTVARTAADHGAAVATWTEVTGFRKDAGGAVTGATVRPTGGEPIDVRAAVVVNAAGVWSDDIRELDDGVHPEALRPAKGVHVTVPWAKVRNDIAAVVPVPKDRRSVFVVPSADNGHTYIGTTDTDYDGPIDDPVCTAEDVEYLLEAMNASLEEPLTPDDVLGTWAGLRPLVRSASSARTADLSRRHSVIRSRSGVISVTGGKLTTYRKMAADGVDAVVKALGRGGRSRTVRLRLHGADGFDAMTAPDAAERLGVDAATLAHLAGRYGGDARVVAAMVVADPDLGRPLVEGLPHLRAEAVYAARYEMAQTLDDVLSRRIPARWLAAEASAAAAEDTARLVAPELGWTDEDVDREVAAYRAAVAAERDAAGLRTVPA
jgi:glycerol-3-phosphate dehydrogenase